MAVPRAASSGASRCEVAARRLGVALRCTAMKVSPLIAWAVFAYTVAIIIAILTLLPNTWWPWAML